jgi:hypothetical protein
MYRPRWLRRPTLRELWDATRVAAAAINTTVFVHKHAGPVIHWVMTGPGAELQEITHHVAHWFGA